MSIAEISAAGYRRTGPVLVLAWLAVAASTSAQQKLSTDDVRPYLALPCRMQLLRLEELRTDYREIIERWSRRDPSAVVDLDALGRRIVDAAAGFPVTDHNLRDLPHRTRVDVGKILALVPGMGCLNIVEDDLLSRLVATDQESRLPLWALYLNLYDRQLRATDATRQWLTTRTRERLDWFLKVGRGAAARRDAYRSVNVLMILTLADEMQSSPFHPLSHEALVRFERAASLAPDSVAARYWAGAMAERLGDFKAATQHFSKLARQHPGDSEIDLRLALCRSRTGKRRAAQQELSVIARTATTDWLAILAYEELIRLQKRRSPSQARQTVVEAVARFPDEPQLRLQLISALVLEGSWEAIDELVPRLEQVRLEGNPLSPRLRYDVPRRDELNADLGRLARRIGAQLPALEGALAREAAEPELSRMQKGSGDSPTRPGRNGCGGRI